MVRTPDLRLLLSGTGIERVLLVKANGRAGVTGHIGIVSTYKFSYNAPVFRRVTRSLSVAIVYKDCLRSESHTDSEVSDGEHDQILSSYSLEEYFVSPGEEPKEQFFSLTPLQ